MDNTREDIERLQEELKNCQKFLTAIGDETRLYLLQIMLSDDCKGSRVIELAKRTNLSRPAVSHHIQVLKDAEIVNNRKEGRFVYYYLDPSDGEIEKMLRLMTDIKQIAENLPDRSGETETI